MYQIHFWHFVTWFNMKFRLAGVFLHFYKVHFLGVFILVRIFSVEQNHNNGISQTYRSGSDWTVVEGENKHIACLLVHVCYICRALPQLLGRMGSEAESGQAALYLAADATFCTGIDLLLSGGAELNYGEKTQIPSWRKKITKVYNVNKRVHSAKDASCSFHGVTELLWGGGVRFWHPIPTDLAITCHVSANQAARCCHASDTSWMLLRNRFVFTTH